MKLKSLSAHVWLVSALSLFVDGYILYISAVAEPWVIRSFSPSPFFIGLTQAAAPLGAAIGAILIGPMSDRFGRKSLLIANLFFFVVVALFTASAWSNLSLCIFRLLIGFGVGADYPLCAAYLSEMIPKDKNNRFIAAAMLINCLAAPTTVLVAWGLHACFPSDHLWRLMYASVIIPALLGVILRSSLPESFTWQVHRDLAAQNKHLFKNFKYLFEPKLKKITICLACCWFLHNISYYGIGLYLPYLLEHLNLAELHWINVNNGTYGINFAINLCIILGALAAIFSVEKINLVSMQKFGFLMAFCALSFLSYQHLAHFDAGNPYILIIGFMLFNFFINFGPGITTYLLPTKIYDSHIKATGHGMAAGCGKLGAFTGAACLPFIHHAFGINAVFILLSISLFMGWTLTHFVIFSESSSPQFDTISLDQRLEHDLSTDSRPIKVLA